ncbi:hypothetical protein CFP56_029237 [Quercus suber]|uniref:F-box associated beta-propeller type 3 domain-containing protein n=1 Tax=Quercus suber TaxID=58331 RepID=A0AAW0MB97_QUESU
MARKKTKALKEDEEDYISHLPHFVVTDILTRLPFKTLFNCRFRVLCETSSGGFMQWVDLNRRGEFVMIRPDINLTPSLWCPRLRFCPKTQVYKVVLLSKHYGVEESNREPTLVYTLGVKGNNVWKRVNVGDDVYGETTGSVFLNGIIHWVVTSYFVPQYIYSFDVEDECFQSVPPPLEIESPERTKLGIGLGVLEGCLAICESPKNDGRNFHIWIGVAIFTHIYEPVYYPFYLDKS